MQLTIMISSMLKGSPPNVLSCYHELQGNEAQGLQGTARTAGQQDHRDRKTMEHKDCT